MEQDEAGETLTITPQEDKVFRETFNSIDTYNRKWIPASQIGYALRINGQCPTEKDIEEIIQNVTEENQSAEEAKLEYDDFKAIMKQYSKTKDELNAIIDEAFLTFDKKDCGLIEESELRKALATLGEILDETEINEFMKDGKVGTDGRLPYGDFAKHLVDSYPRPGSKKKGSGKKGASAASKKSKKK